jgi:peptide/nickel transport system ATP-binding protein
VTTLTQPEPAPPSRPAAGPFLSVRDLYVRFSGADGTVKAVDGLSFGLERGRTLGIVGESGSGKSVTNLAILGLHDPRNTVVGGEILLDGQELTGASERTLEKLRGDKMAMIFQDSLTALSPYYTVGRQIMEPFRKHTGASRKEARERAVEMLGKVGIPQPRTRVDDYPHQFSGGMRQRAMIALALVCDPELLIADEPTTALDVTVQAQILDLLKELQQQSGTAIIFVTHDLGVVAQVCDDVLVMYAGRCVEHGTMREVLGTPRHPYTWGLLSSVPRLSSDVEAPLSPIPGSPPSLLDPPGGCPFHPRCAFPAEVGGTRCADERPAPPPEQGRGAACHLTDDQQRTLFDERIRPHLVPRTKTPRNAR